MAHGKQSESQVGENHKSKKKWVSKFDIDIDINIVRL